MRLPRRLLAAISGDEGLRGTAAAARPCVVQRLGAALLVDQGPHERPRAPIACPVEDCLGECTGGAADAWTVAIVCTGDQVDETREGSSELERDGEERADGGCGPCLGLRGKEPPAGRL